MFQLLYHGSDHDKGSDNPIGGHQFLLGFDFGLQPSSYALDIVPTSEL
jgi:hypothetical protein